MTNLIALFNKQQGLLVGPVCNNSTWSLRGAIRFKVMNINRTTNTDLQIQCILLHCQVRALHALRTSVQCFLFASLVLVFFVCTSKQIYTAFCVVTCYTVCYVNGSFTHSFASLLAFIHLLYFSCLHWFALVNLLFLQSAGTQLLYVPFVCFL